MAVRRYHRAVNTDDHFDRGPEPGKTLLGRRVLIIVSPNALVSIKLIF